VKPSKRNVERLIKLVENKAKGPPKQFKYERKVAAERARSGGGLVEALSDTPARHLFKSSNRD
jgi:hypothetical protein